jgi:nucleoside-diphosphate-sugar epimerase
LLKILVIGSSGNLGSPVCQNLKICGFEVIESCREGTSDSFRKAVIYPWKDIKIPNEQIPDLIINLSNKYILNPSISQISEMRDSIEGIAQSIVNSNGIWKVPIISVSSYFQYLPSESLHWAEYVSAKKTAALALQSHASDLDLAIIEVVLFDNYGGGRRTKFLDQLIYHAIKGTSMDANPGMSLLNLTHVNDISRAITECVNQLTCKGEKIMSRIEICSPVSHSLKELEEIVESTAGKKLSVNWGALSYRDYEVFSIEHNFPTLQNWLPTITIEDYVTNQIFRLNN